jgi:acetolactate synthase I/II/III large subunit
VNGAERLISTAVACGVEVCFANPGTTEMPLVVAMDRVSGLRPVLGLFEGVCSGAADGYARMVNRPAMTLFHLGPGFANGIANFHNARRARSPVLNVIGDHATWHAPADPPLNSDIVSLARPVSGWLRSVRRARSIASDTAEAVAAAGRGPGRVATLIVPSDCLSGPADGPADPGIAAPPPTVPATATRAAAELLRERERCVLFLGGAGLREQALTTAARIAASTGCGLMCETLPARLERGRGRPSLPRLPYFPEQALGALSRFTAMVLAGAPAPVAFFGYPNHPSSVVPEGTKTTILAQPEQDVPGALAALADLIGASPAPALRDPDPPSAPTGPLSPSAMGAAFATVAPEHTILVDEGATAGFDFFTSSRAAPSHTYLSLTGGAIGYGLPAAVGAAVACPDRQVVCLEADGCGMYTLQALWTAAREALNLVTLICNNRRYRILQVELARGGITEPGPHAVSLTSLANPEIHWTELARGMGVDAVRVETAESLTGELARAIKEPGPRLIEMLI